MREKGCVTIQTYIVSISMLTQYLVKFVRKIKVEMKLLLTGGMTKVPKDEMPDTPNPV